LVASGRKAVGDPWKSEPVLPTSVPRSRLFPQPQSDNVRRSHQTTFRRAPLPTAHMYTRAYEPSRRTSPIRSRTEQPTRPPPLGPEEGGRGRTRRKHFSPSGVTRWGSSTANGDMYQRTNVAGGRPRGGPAQKKNHKKPVLDFLTKKTVSRTSF